MDNNINSLQFELIYKKEIENKCCKELFLGGLHTTQNRYTQELQRAFVERMQIPSAISIQEGWNRTLYYEARAFTPYARRRQTRLTNQSQRFVDTLFPFAPSIDRRINRQSIRTVQQRNPEDSPHFSALMSTTKIKGERSLTEVNILYEKKKLEMPKATLLPGATPLHQIVQLDEERDLKLLFDGKKLFCWINPTSPLIIEVPSHFLNNVKVPTHRLQIHGWRKEKKILILLSNPLCQEAIRFTVHWKEKLLSYNPKEMVAYSQVPQIDPSTSLTLQIRGKECFTAVTSSLSLISKPEIILWYFSKKGGVKSLSLPCSPLLNEHSPSTHATLFDLSFLSFDLSCAIAYTKQNHPPLIDFFDKKGNVFSTWSPQFETKEERCEGFYFFKEGETAYCLLGSLLHASPENHLLSLYKISPSFAETGKVSGSTFCSELLALLPTFPEKKRKSQNEGGTSSNHKKPKQD